MAWTQGPWVQAETRNGRGWLVHAMRDVVSLGGVKIGVTARCGMPAERLAPIQHSDGSSCLWSDGPMTPNARPCMACNRGLTGSEVTRWT